MRRLYFKRIFALLTAVLLALGGIMIQPVNANAAGTRIIKEIRVTGSYTEVTAGKVLTSSASYSDRYFYGKATAENVKLAKLSMLASAATYDREYALALMESLKFVGRTYKQVPVTKTDNDHVSYAIGHKTINGFEVIAVWIRGTGMDYEWVSNFNMGTGKTHAGFSAAEAELWKSVNAYIRRKNLSDAKLKFWITGHSRGAAVGNLFAKRMTDRYGSSKVYAYTFATPRVSTAAKKTGYSNIRNYLNSGDYITELPPKEWNYKRYGTDITFRNASKNAMKAAFKEKTGISYGGFTKAEKEALAAAVLKYAGEHVRNYYAKNDWGESPSDFFQNGLGYMLANDEEGMMKVLMIAYSTPEAAEVYKKLSFQADGGIKFVHAHCLTGYITWMNAMYPD